MVDGDLSANTKVRVDGAASCGVKSFAGIGGSLGIEYAGGKTA